MHASTSVLFPALVGAVAASSNSTYISPSASPSHPSSVRPSLSGPTGGSSLPPTKSLLPTGGSSSIPPTKSPFPTGGSSSQPPYPTKSTETLTTITTVTTCPITITHIRSSSRYIETTLTTKTMTITSCKNGCNHYPTGTSPAPQAPQSETKPLPSQKPTHPPYASGSTTETITTVYPTIITSVIPKWIPCSTPVSSNSPSTYYSTWLSYAPTTTTYVSTCTDSYTLFPSSPPASMPTPVSPPGESTCPPATVTVYPSVPPKDCKTCYETITATLPNGKPTTITLTNWPAPTAESTNGTGNPKPSTSSKPVGSGSYTVPKPTGYKLF